MKLDFGVGDLVCHRTELNSETPTWGKIVKANREQVSVEINGNLEVWETKRTHLKKEYDSKRGAE